MRDKIDEELDMLDETEVNMEDYERLFLDLTEEEQEWEIEVIRIFSSLM